MLIALLCLAGLGAGGLFVRHRMKVVSEQLALEEKRKDDLAKDRALWSRKPSSYPTAAPYKVEPTRSYSPPPYVPKVRPAEQFNVEEPKKVESHLLEDVLSFGAGIAVGSLLSDDNSDPEPSFSPSTDNDTSSTYDGGGSSSSWGDDSSSSSSSSDSSSSSSSDSGGGGD